LSVRVLPKSPLGKAITYTLKNWLFAGSVEGARNAAILFSLIVSCKLHSVDPFAYLRDMLVRIHTHPADRIHELIPRQWKQHFGLPADHPPATPASTNAA